MERRASPLERGVLGGLAVFRAVAWAWMAVVLYVSRRDLGRPGPAVALCAVVAIVTAVLGSLSRRRPALLLRPPAVVGEVALAVAIATADGWVYGGPHSQTLGSVWPLAGVMAAGVAGGPVAGVAAGVAVGAGRYAGTHLDQLDTPGLLVLLSTTFLYALAGGASGVVMRRLQRAEDEISAARAREEVARTLHDGVLQTLAVVQRRSPDSDLADLAREQERELRQFLFGLDHERGDLLTELRRVAATAEARHGLNVSLTVVDTPRRLPDKVVAALAGATGEALTNAAKHGGSSHVVVFVDPGADELLVSVNDDGTGFDTAATPEGVGMGRSIRGRMAEVDGSVEVRSTPGDGTEVALRVPTPSR